MVSLRFHLAACAWLIASALHAAEPATDVLDQWFEKQKALKTWRADFVQTRTLKTLTVPLTTPGKAMFSAPNQFRWELGVPAQTVAIRGAQEMVVLYPKLSRAERFQLDTEHAGKMKDLLVLLEAGFPRDRKELESRFKILQQGKKGDAYEVSMQPRSSLAKRLMPELRLSFNMESMALLSTEMIFSDGSNMRTDFTHPEMNPELGPELFGTTIPKDYQVTEPLKSK